jgi:DNA-binding NarL/FixJ family response regulator
MQVGIVGGVAPERQDDVHSQVGIADPLPALRYGVRTALEAAGFGVAEPADVAAWAAGDGSRVVLLGLVAAESWAALDAVVANAGSVPLVALLDRPSTEEYRRCLRLGATTALPRASSPEQIVEVVRAASGHQTLLPAAVAASLAGSPDPALVLLDPDQLRWLRGLAAGMTVEELAWKEGYSTRTMYRRLHHVYRRLDAGDRTRALIRALELGLLPDRRELPTTLAAPG